MIILIFAFVIVAGCTSEKKNNNSTKTDTITETKKDTASQETTETVKDETPKTTDDFKKLIQEIEPIPTSYIYNNKTKIKKSIPVEESFYKVFYPEKKSVESMNLTAKCKLPAQKNFQLVIMESRFTNGERGDETYMHMYSFDKNGKIIDDISVQTYRTGSYSTFRIYKDDITLFTEYYDGDDFNTPSEISDTKYKVGTDGKFTQTRSTKKYADIIGEYFSDTNMRIIQEARKSYYGIKSSKDIANILNNQKNKLIEIVNTGVDLVRPRIEYAEDGQFFEDYIPSIKIIGVDGGVMVGCNYYNLYKKALNTPQKDDDNFFDAYTNGQKLEGDYLMQFSASECMSMEECYSLLGGGECYKALKKISTQIKLHNDFEKQLKKMQAQIISEMNHPNFGYAKKDVLKYLQKISELDLPKEYSKTLTDLKTKIVGMKNLSFSHKKN